MHASSIVVLHCILFSHSHTRCRLADTVYVYILYYIEFRSVKVTHGVDLPTTWVQRTQCYNQSWEVNVFAGSCSNHFPERVQPVAHTPFLIYYIKSTYALLLLDGQWHSQPLGVDFLMTRKTSLLIWGEEGGVHFHPYAPSTTPIHNTYTGHRGTICLIQHPRLHANFQHNTNRLKRTRLRKLR